MPKDMEQVVGRLHRIGQEGNVLVQIMIAPDSLDERMMRRVLEKLQSINVTLDGE